MTQKIQGVLPVVHMPYNADLSIDYSALEAQVDWLFATGAQGFCLALVSDLLRLGAQERLELPAKLVGFAKGRGPVVISVGAESTLQAQAFARAAQEGGAAAAMAIPPLSRALSEDQLRAYFEGILETVEIPLIVQDASSYVGKAMSIDFQAGLFQRHGQRILFKPEATPLGPCISALRARTGGKAALFEGSGGVLLIDSHRRGVTGTIPGGRGRGAGVRPLLSHLCHCRTADAGRPGRLHRHRALSDAEAGTLQESGAPRPAQL
jgi:dihydrodipicolinate synthase/N-acetylneuraminate lyase